MNFLNRACVGQSGRAALWGTSCACGDPLKKSSAGPTQISHTKLVPHGKSTNNCSLTKVCSKSLNFVTRPALWTQVRFNKPSPRFHRDLEYPSFDDYRKEQYIDVRSTSWGQGDGKAGITYMMGFAFGVTGMYAAKSICTYLASSMSAAADVLALASVEVDLTRVAPGACDVIKWRGKPLFVKHRTPADIELENNTNLSLLRDPESPEIRSQKPEWLIVIGICTHLGCVPIANTGDFSGGFYCPCHGSHYDNLGRIRKGPAPTNLVIPPYKFVTDTQVLVG